MAPLTQREQIDAQLPETWRDEYIRQQDPVTAQRLTDARAETLDDIKRTLTTKRRPNPYFSDAIDEGSIDDL